jgi:protein TonB
MAPGWEEFVSIPSLLARRVRAGFVLSSERERMERPNHLKTAQTSNSSKLTGFIIVVLIHVAAITALVTALASGQIMKQIQDIKASVEAEKIPPKAPPPPPPDLAKPPPPAAIVPEFSVQQEAPPPSVTTQPKPPPPPPKTTAVQAAPTELKPIARTHSLPPYPTISQRLGEQGTSQLQVNINTEGSVSDCKIAKSSGSERLDNAACEYVKGHWKWQPPTQEGKPVAATTMVDVVWNLKNAQ